MKHNAPPLKTAEIEGARRHGQGVFALICRDLVGLVALHGLLSTGKYGTPSLRPDNPSPSNEHMMAQAVDHAASIADKFMASFFGGAAPAAQGEGGHGQP